MGYLQCFKMFKNNLFFIVENKNLYFDDDVISVRSDDLMKTPASSISSHANFNLPSKSSSLNLSGNRIPSPVPSFSQTSQTRSSSIVNENLQKLNKQLQIELFKQLLKLKNINFEWFDIIMPLVWKCVDLVRPDVKHDGDYMDIRKYINI